MMASAISLVIGAPLSGALLSIGTVFGMSGWRWMFVLEGVPSVLLGIVALRYLTDRPQDAVWLTDEQRAWLVSTLHREAADNESGARVSSLGEAFRHPGLWTIGGVYFCIGLSFYGISFWLPQIIRQLSGLSPLTIGLLTAVPFVAAAAAMVLNGWHSDRTGERRWHIAVSCLLGASGFVIGAAATSPTIVFLGLCIGAVGIWGSIGVFWSLPTEFLSGTAAAGGIALVNSLGNVGGFVGPYLIGWLRTRSADFGTSLLLIAGVLAAGSLMVLALRQRRSLPAIQHTA
jgi:ACS family tartrate transporter-like MFS transporter